MAFTLSRGFLKFPLNTSLAAKPDELTHNSYNDLCDVDLKKINKCSHTPSFVSTCL